MDAEAQKDTGRGRLQLFLLVAVVLLFVAVAAVAAGGVLVVMELRHELETSRTTFKTETAEKSTGEAPPVYKMQNFAYLRATTALLQSSSMTWAPLHYGEGDSVGSHFIYDKDQHHLHPRREGTYFLYLDLHFSCTYNCSKAHVTLHVGDKLICAVELPAVADKRPVSKKCWTVALMDGITKLSSDMTVRPDGPMNWKLDVKRSGLGMFLVD